MKAAGKDERREFFRTQARLLLGFREISYEEYLLLQENLRHSSAAFPKDRLLSESPTTPAHIRDLYSYLEILDGKLNIIIDSLSKKDELFRSRYVEANISGSGVRFWADTKLEEGGYIELRITLSGFPDVRIYVLGRTVRVRPGPSGNEKGWETAIRFTAISEKDRDLLINYIFSKEREHLRARKTLR